MKLIKTLHRFNHQFLTKLPSDIYLKSLTLFCAIAALSVIIWIGGPLLTWGNYAPFAQQEQRLYLILFLFLLGLLKVLIFDLDTPNPLQHSDPYTQKKLQALQSRFDGALRFMKQKTLHKQNAQLRLNQLPRFLLIGPVNAGKTSLLAHSGVNFILQRQFHSEDIRHLKATENFDWWITRDASIIDVPGKYFTGAQLTKNQDSKPSIYPHLWKFFLRLIKKHHGKNGIDGILIALPLPELMKLNDMKAYHAMLRNLFQRLFELQSVFTQSIPCQLVITKCDALAGFKEFFGESSHDEIAQAWGITMPAAKSTEKSEDIFAHRFNALIKKLNQQLLWRLHQERNPMARPYIKDFPLQVERLKEFIQDFIKKFAGANFKLSLEGVYLTSAMQSEPDPEANIIDEAANTTQRAVALFKEPSAASRAFFVKQFLAHGLTHHHSHGQPNHSTTHTPVWVKRTAYAVSAGVVGLAALTLGKDFQQGVEQAYAVQTNLTDYKLTIRQVQNPDEHLAKTLALLDTLHLPEADNKSKFDLSSVVSFYSQKSKQNADIAYNQALQTILLPEIKNYLGEYLKNPINKNAENVYGAFKAYLMLGDARHFEGSFITNNMQQIMPKTLNQTQSSHLLKHIAIALNTAWKPMPLDTNLVQETRRYLSATPSLQLSYIILKNIDSNNADSEINLGMNAGNAPVFTSLQVTNQIPAMFTAKAFSGIISQEVTMAAEESLIGNWVLGENANANHHPEQITSLLEELRSTYISNYVDIWETLISNIHLSTPTSLAETDAIITGLTASNSPLLQLLQTLHDNTYFEPITSTSPKLQSIALLADKSKQSQAMLYQVTASLQAVHRYLQTILSAENEKKAAFEAVSSHMQHRNGPDVITQLFLVAEQSPEPLKSWLDNLGNTVWHYLMQDAGHYLDFSWQEQVGHTYQTDIANRYPFNINATNEVDLDAFTKFFGNPGTLISFYNNYLQPLIDTSSPEWHWRTVNKQKLPFSEDTLRQIQNAMNIHHAFFPNGDDKLYVQFALQPYRFGRRIKSVQLNIDNKQFIDERYARAPHTFTWPNSSKFNFTSVQLTMSNQKTMRRQFTGPWGSFKLVNQSFQSINSKNQMLLNLSMNEHPVRYVLLTDAKNNPFMSLNLKHFQLPEQLTERKS